MAFEIFKLFGSIFVDTSEANNEMDLAGNNAEILGKKFGAVAKTADNISDGLKGLGKGFSTYVTAPLTAIGTGAVLAFNAVDDGMDVMLKATGATGDAANGLEKIFKNVSGSVIGSFDDVGGAIGEINTRFGVTGDGLETMSKDFLKFAEITGVDATQGVQLVSRAMSDAGIDTADYKSVLDQLSAASQASGISVEALTENITKYGAPMRALGFDTQESIAIFAGWEKAGVNTEIAFSGMKKAISNWAAAGKDPREEFKKTLQLIGETPDIASATTMAIDVFGQKAGPDLADAIKGGRFSYEEFLAVVENSEGTLDGTYDELLDGGAKFEMSMQNVKESMATLGEAIMNTLAPMLEAAAVKASELAGWFESLNEGQQDTIVKLGLLAMAIGPILLVLGGLAGAVSNVAGLFATGGLLNGALGSASAAFGLGAEGAVGMGSSLAALTGPVAIVVAAIAGFVAILAGAWQNSETFRGSVAAAFMALKMQITMNLMAIQEAFAPVVEAFSGFGASINPILQQIGDFIGNNIVPKVREFISEFINGFTSIIIAIAPFVAAIGNLLSFIGNFVGMVFALLNGDWAAAWQFAQAMGQNAVDFLVNVFQGLHNWVSLIFQSILDFIKGIWDGIVQRTTDTWNGIVTFLQTAWQLIYDNTIGKISELATNIANKWQETKVDTQQKWDAIKSDLAAKWEEIKTNISNKVQEVVTNLANKWQETKSDTQQKWADIKTDLASKWEDIKTNISNKVQETVKNVSDKWQETKTDSDSKWGDIRDDLKNKAQEIFRNITEKIRELVDDLPDKWQDIKDAASEKWEEIKKTIIDPIAQVPEQLYQQAKNMISEIVRGISETASNVGDAVNALVKDILAKFKDGLGIASPAKKLIEIGKYIVQGLIKGLNGENLISFVNGMVEDIKSAFENGNFNLKAAIDFVGSGAAEFFKSIGIGGASMGDLTAPLSAGVTSEFGWRTHPIYGDQRFHAGIDLGAGYGEPVGAAGAGTVVQAGWNGGYGNSVIIDHGNGLETLYAHMSEIMVAVGDIVSKLQTIGLVGSTGDSTGAHLHFGMMQDGEWIDPSALFGYASGTNYATAGLHWVGEKGPELVNFRGGERVYDAETSAGLAGGKDGITQYITINSPTALSPATIAKQNERLLRHLFLSL
ncbi:phage tail tape measure protein [Acetobacterium malicum]|uniref:phage tail tape measure protein n=1 Tax=Acetobacterium malicum TaxID=52692 RepID=UPI00041C6284|nr:phage tail tape measure protein [Acetobacterium dehalogenans]